MTKTWIIARKELASYLSSWTGYIIAASSLFVCGLLFNAFAIGDQPEFSEVILSRFFYFLSGVGMVAAVCLAMRLIAEERQRGTMVVYYTAPVSEREVVYGKFLSAFVFFLFLLVLTFYMPALLFIYGKVSIGHLVAGYFGVSLIGAAVLSLGLCASTLASSQLLAAILGAVFTVSLLILWMLSSISTGPLRDLFAYLAIHNDRFEPFRKGLVHSRDVIYYLSLTVLMLECSVSILASRRWRG